MKKNYFAIFVLIFCLGLVACGSENTNNQSISNGPTNIVTTSEPTKSAEKNDKTSYESVYITLCEYFINYDSSRREAQKHTSTVFYKSGVDAFQVIWGVAKYKDESVKNVFNENTTILYDIDSYVDAYLDNDNNSLVIEHENVVTISENEFLRFSGYINDEKEKKICSVYGYSFEMNGKPSMILGYETDDSRMSAFCSEIDAVIESVRLEK